MMRAYVLINALPGRALEVVEKIRRVPGVTAADAITGQYDVIASFEARDFAVLGSAVVDKIQKLDGVRRTVTCLVLTE
jgi:DNA-binding Lrp family transcriptional regulator